MSENDILDLIKNDVWMMEILQHADKINLPDWAIGAGFVRNKVWDHLHGYVRRGVVTNDIDLVYFDPTKSDQALDEELSQRLQHETRIKWEIVNEAYAHKWNSLQPFKSTEDAISHWPEVATCVGVRLERDDLQLIAPLGIDDLVSGIIRPNKKLSKASEVAKTRVKEKGWLEKWPKLTLVGFDFIH